jgi:hypothetical protein
MEEKHRQDNEARERKLQLLLKATVNQNTANLDVEALAALISAPTTNVNSVLCSSTSTHALNGNEVRYKILFVSVQLCLHRPMLVFEVSLFSRVLKNRYKRFSFPLYQ